MYIYIFSFSTEKAEIEIYKKKLKTYVFKT